jgi:3-phosphoshikimate 1-carboxyvinyltransferase
MEAMVGACRLFGARIGFADTQIEIEGLNGTIDHTEDVIDANNSGIVLRCCSALGALSSRPVVVTGDLSVRHSRPMEPLLHALRQSGVSATSMRGDGFAPVIIQGPIHSGRVVIDGADSQPVSALMIAAAFAQGPIEISVENPGERPWIDLTIHWLDRMGIRYERRGYEWFRMFGQSQYAGFQYDVPGDFSSAAFPIAAALVTHSALAIGNLDFSDPQGDKEVISIFQRMGAELEIDPENKRLHVRQSGPLKGVEVDINNCIDALPILAVVACFASTPTRLFNGAVARQKECDRIRYIATELRKMGAQITEHDDGLLISPSALYGAPVVMALTIAGFGASGVTEVGPVGCVAKSYPTFDRDFNSIGGSIQ